MEKLRDVEVKVVILSVLRDHVDTSDCVSDWTNRMGVYIYMLSTSSNQLYVSKYKKCGHIRPT